MIHRDKCGTCMFVYLLCYCQFIRWRFIYYYSVAVNDYVTLCKLFRKMTKVKLHITIIKLIAIGDATEKWAFLEKHLNVNTLYGSPLVQNHSHSCCRSISWLRRSVVYYREKRDEAPFLLPLSLFRINARE